MKKGPVTIRTNFNPNSDSINNSISSHLGFTHNLGSPKGIFFSSAFFYSRYNLSSMPGHCCCSWGSTHGAGFFKTLGSSAATGLHFHPQPLVASHVAKPQLLCTIPLVLAHWVCTFTNGLSQCPALLVLHDPFMPTKSVAPRWLSHHQVQRQAQSATSASSQS